MRCETIIEDNNEFSKERLLLIMKQIAQYMWRHSANGVVNVSKEQLKQSLKLSNVCFNAAMAGLRGIGFCSKSGNAYVIKDYKFLFDSFDKRERKKGCKPQDRGSVNKGLIRAAARKIAWIIIESRDGDKFYGSINAIEKRCGYKGVDVKKAFDLLLEIGFITLYNSSAKSFYKINQSLLAGI